MDALFPGLDLAPNVHPVFVHFPIALWATSLLFFVLGARGQRDRLVETGRWLLYLGTLGAVAAAVTGFVASDGLGHDTPGHSLVHVHRDWMLVASGIAVAVTIGAIVLRDRSWAATRWALVVAMVVLNATALLGADRGAQLVFGYGVGTANREPPASEDGRTHEQNEEPEQTNGEEPGADDGHAEHEH